MLINMRRFAEEELKSLNSAIAKYKIPYGIRISQKKLELEGNILSVPFYAISEIPRLIKELPPKTHCV